MKDKLSDFEKMCFALEKQLEAEKYFKEPKCKYELADAAVRRYAQNGNILNLKGESVAGVFFEFFSVGGTLLSILVAVITLFVTLFSYNIAVKGVIIVVVAVLSIVLYRFMRKYLCINTWKGHIQIAIEKFLSEQKEENQQDEEEMENVNRKICENTFDVDILDHSSNQHKQYQIKVNKRKI